MKITDYVSDDTARWLKSVGYPQEGQGIIVSKCQYDPNTDSETTELDYIRPSLWDAMKWLREKKDMFAYVEYNTIPGHGVWIPHCTQRPGKKDLCSLIEFCHYEVACDAAIVRACLWLKQFGDTKTD